jgi:hypothetical protein
MSKNELERMEVAAMEFDRAEEAGLRGEDLERARQNALARQGLDNRAMARIHANLELEQLRRSLRSREEP